MANDQGSPLGAEKHNLAEKPLNLMKSPGWNNQQERPTSTVLEDRAGTLYQYNCTNAGILPP